MKRKGKCVGKKTFAFKSAALQTAAYQYQTYGKELGVYECPTCLDFHLTSKYCNTSQYHKQWIKLLAKTLQREEEKFDRKYFGITVTKKRRKKRGSVQNIQKQVSKSVIERKQNTLPLAKQKEIFAHFDGKIYPQHNAFWHWIRGILIGKRAGHRHALITN